MDQMRVSAKTRRPGERSSVPSRRARHWRRRDPDRRIRHGAEAVAALLEPMARGARAHPARATRVLADESGVARCVCPHRRGGAASRGETRFVPQGRDDAQNQARYELIDFVLDPMPFGGVNGTLEALDMGVPVVTLVGKRHGERSACSILAHLGVTDTVAQTGEEYVEIACRLALDPVFMRRCAPRSARDSPVAARRRRELHARSLERAYVRRSPRRCPMLRRRRNRAISCALRAVRHLHHAIDAAREFHGALAKRRRDRPLP